MFGNKKKKSRKEEKPEVSRQKSIDQSSNSLVPQSKTEVAQPTLTARQPSLTIGNDQSHRQRSGTHDPQISKPAPATSDRPKSTASNKASTLPAQQRNISQATTRPAGATTMEPPSQKSNTGTAITDTRQPPVVNDKLSTSVKSSLQQPIQPGPSKASPLLIRRETESLKIVDITDTTYTMESKAAHGQNNSTDPQAVINSNDPLHLNSGSGSGNTNQVLVTFYLNSSSMDKFPESDLEKLAGIIGHAFTEDTPTDVMIRKEECFRRCYRFVSNDQDDENRVIVGVRVLSGTCGATVCEKISGYYGTKLVRVITESNATSTAVELVESYTPMEKSK